MLKVRCQSPVTLDSKGRLALPATLRRALSDAGVGQLVLTFHRGAIWGWTPDEFESTVETPMAQRDPFSGDVMDFSHALLAPAQDVEVDGQGRIRIPPPLRELAGLDRDVMLNSLLNRIELWDKERWFDRFRQSLDRSGRLPGMPGGGAA